MHLCLPSEKTLLWGEEKLSSNFLVQLSTNQRNETETNSAVPAVLPHGQRLCGDGGSAREGRGVLLVARAVFVQQSSAGQRVSLSLRQQRRSLFQQHWKGSHAACLPISPR